jgi:hypothetical protein
MVMDRSRVVEESSKIKISAVRFGSVRFLSYKPKTEPNQSVFNLYGPNTSEKNRFFAVFGFFGSVGGFFLDRFGSEHP